MCERSQWLWAFFSFAITHSEKEAATANRKIHNDLCKQSCLLPNFFHYIYKVCYLTVSLRVLNVLNRNGRQKKIKDEESKQVKTYLKKQLDAQAGNPNLHPNERNFWANLNKFHLFFLRYLTRSADCLPYFGKEKLIESSAWSDFFLSLALFVNSSVS